MKNKINRSSSELSRRDFLRIGAALGVTIRVPSLARAAVNQLNQPMKIGLISDLHHDLMHDGQNRLEAFCRHIRKIGTDGIIQLGDFAYPNEKNKNLIALFNQAHETRLHVIGNHDTDAGHTKQQCIDNWGMPDRYYAQKIKGIWLIVLDGNEKGSPDYKGGYPAYINPEQILWLKKKLTEISEPIIVISHQPLAGALAVDNAIEIQEILANAADRVLVAINGHTHIDSLHYAKGIPYLTINSASYFWAGDKFSHESYAKEIHQTHEWISRTFPYRDPLFTTLTIDPASATLLVEGKSSQWVGQSPVELGYNEPPFRIDQEITPVIRNRKIRSGKNH